MKIIKKILFIIFTFYLIYLPDFSVYQSLIPNTSIIVTILALINVVLLNRNFYTLFKSFNLHFVYSIILILSIQLFILNLIYGFNIYNIWPLILFAIQIINYLSLVIWFNKLFLNSSRYRFIDFIIFIGIIQSCIIILMIFIPTFKEVAVTLYGGDDGVPIQLQYFLSYRIYGIGSSYTFILPLTQALIAILALFNFSSTRRYKYIIFSLALVISSMVNSRTGLYIYLLVISIYIFTFMFKKIKLKELLILLISFLFFVSSFIIFSETSSERLNWITEGFNEVSALLLEGEIQSNQNIGRLIGEHLQFPQGIDLFFGTGQRIFGGIDYQGQHINSDIGYINDLFKGGIFYILIFYGVVSKYIVKNIKKRLLLLTIILFMIIANYKGEIMTGSPLLMLIISLAFASQYDRIKVDDNTNNNFLSPTLHKLNNY